MSQPQHIHYGVGGQVLFVDLNDRPSNALVTVVDGSGSAKFSSRTCNVSTINTIINVAATKGAMTITVASNTGIEVGKKFWLQDDPEEVLVRKVSGGTVHLRRPLNYDHVVNAAAEGTRISYTTNATDANAMFWDGHADWNVDGKVKVQTAVCCTKYPMIRTTTVQDVVDEEPMLYHMLDPKMDVERTLDLAWDDVLGRVAAKSPEARDRVWPASSEFNKATVFAFMERFYRRRPGDENKRMQERYDTKLQHEIELICGVLPRDADQDGTVEVEEKLGWGSVRIRRG
jgi:prepilin-type processing-associated H-X9-DG protein